MLTLKGFKDSFVRMDTEEGCEEIGFDFENFSDSFDDPEYIHVGENDLFLTQHDTRRYSEFHTFFGRTEVDGTFDECATALYFGWYLTECFDPTELTLDRLSHAWEEFCDAYSQPCISADELLAAHENASGRPFKTRLIVSLIADFITLWEKASEIELKVYELGKMLHVISFEALGDAFLKRVRKGENPNDFCDWNQQVYGAFCAVNFREPDAANTRDTALMNAAMTICIDKIKKESV